MWARPGYARRFLKQDKGSIILEGVVSLGVVSMLTLGYTSVAAHASLTQRTAVNESIAVQAAQEALEKAKATHWSKIGTDAPSTVELPEGVTPIEGGTLPAKAPPTVIRNLEVTVRTAVGWQDAPGRDAQYGTKVVVVEVSWEDIQGNPSSVRKKLQQLRITPGIGEAVPSGIRSAEEAGP